MSGEDEPHIALFSYGSLRKPEVQLANFGRLLDGQPDALTGYVLSTVTIENPAAIAASGTAIHDLALPSGNPADLIPGTVFHLTPAELEAADLYEDVAFSKVYSRVVVRLASGVEAFAYVSGGD